MVDDATMGDGHREANAEDIRAALRLYRGADAILIALVAALTFTVIALR
jgi:adenosylcobinamide-phosphate synthase